MEARIIGGCCEHLEGNCVPSRIEIACLKEGKREGPRLTRAKRSEEGKQRG